MNHFIKILLIILFSMIPIGNQNDMLMNLLTARSFFDIKQKLDLTVFEQSSISKCAGFENTIYEGIGYGNFGKTRLFAKSNYDSCKHKTTVEIFFEKCISKNLAIANGFHPYNEKTLVLNNDNMKFELIFLTHATCSKRIFISLD